MEKEEFLSALSKLMDKKFEVFRISLEENIDEANRKIDETNQKIDISFGRLEKKFDTRFTGFEGKVVSDFDVPDFCFAKFDARFFKLEQKIDTNFDKLETQIKRKNTLLETKVIPKLQNLQKCYTSN